MQSKRNPALSVRVAAGEMDSAVSRRDLHTAISSAGSDSDGLAPPSMIVEGVGSISMRKLRDCFAYVLRSNLHHQALGRVKIL
jgi:hypothetical protein